MSREVLMRGFLTVLVAFLLVFCIYDRYNGEYDDEDSRPGRQKYLPYFSSMVLPMYLVMFTALTTWQFGLARSVQMLFSMCFGIFLHISLYYILLMLVLPLLRRHISARSCAMLWILPNYLYLTNSANMRLPAPALVIPVAEAAGWALFALWLAGFCLVLARGVVQHLRFRRSLLAEAAEVEDPEVLAIWEQVLAEARIKDPKFRLVRSPDAATPLSIGLFKRSTRVVLPTENYSPEELELILKHEIVHISREDAWSKFFLLFCTAMCWFNPLMWTAREKSAQDLELSCDETVLLEEDADTRKQYAALLLDTAADGRGFTTCLSASAGAMRYRLANIVAPSLRRSGALAVGIAFFLLCMTSGYVALAYSSQSGAEVLWGAAQGQTDVPEEVTLKHNVWEVSTIVADEDAFLDYVAGLELSRLTGSYTFSGSEREYTLIIGTPKQYMLTLYDDALQLLPMTDLNTRAIVSYHVSGGVDWDYLDTLLTENSTEP